MALGKRKTDEKLKRILENSIQKRSSHFSRSTNKASKEKTVKTLEIEKRNVWKDTSLK